jgi:hypothetical protein
MAQVIAAEMPAGWVSAQFRAGRALLLVDGLDELEPARRLEARHWLEQMVTAYGDARFVVSAPTVRRGRGLAGRVSPILRNHGARLPGQMTPSDAPGSEMRTPIHSTGSQSAKWPSSTSSRTPRASGTMTATE